MDTDMVARRIVAAVRTLYTDNEPSCLYLIHSSLPLICVKFDCHANCNNNEYKLIYKDDCLPVLDTTIAKFTSPLMKSNELKWIHCKKMGYTLTNGFGTSWLNNKSKAICTTISWFSFLVCNPEWKLDIQHKGLCHTDRFLAVSSSTLIWISRCQPDLRSWTYIGWTSGIECRDVQIAFYKWCQTTFLLNNNMHLPWIHDDIRISTNPPSSPRALRHSIEPNTFISIVI